MDMAERPVAGPEVRAEQEEAGAGPVVREEREEREEARAERVVREEREEAKVGAVPEARGVAVVLGPSIRTIRTTTRIP